MIKIYYNKETHKLEKVDVENKISYDWDSNTPKVADFANLVVVDTEIKQERKRDIVYKIRWEIILSVFIIMSYIFIMNIDVSNINNDNITEDIVRIQRLITKFDNQNKSSFGDWRTCKIISECIGKSDEDIQKIIENNALEKK